MNATSPGGAEQGVSDASSVLARRRRGSAGEDRRVRGWVYVISNKAMPGVVKVGYSLKDPSLRARELDNTGAPHPYVVDYEVLTEEPREIERAAHAALREVREGREWFKCTAERAIVAIKEAMPGAAPLHENYVRADRERAETLTIARLARRDAEDKAEAQIKTAQDGLRNTIDAILKRDYPEPAFLPYWIGWSLAAVVGLAIVAPRGPGVGTFVLGAMAGVLCAWLHTSTARDRQLKSAGYLEAIAKRNAAFEQMRVTVEAKYGLRPRPPIQ